MTDSPEPRVLMSAAEARSLKPKWDTAAALSKINTLVSSVAAEGRRQINLPDSVFPPGAWTRLVSGLSSPDGEALIRAFTALGYDVKVQPGGHGGRGYVQLSWAES